MTQTYQKITELENIEDKKHDSTTKDTADDLLGDLNPRYFEEAPSLDDAKQRAYTVHINVGSKFNFFNAF